MEWAVRIPSRKLYFMTKRASRDLQALSYFFGPSSSSSLYVSERLGKTVQSKEHPRRLFDVDYDANPLRRKLFLFWNPQSIDDPLHMNTHERQDRQQSAEATVVRMMGAWIRTTLHLVASSWTSADVFSESIAVTKCFRWVKQH